MFIGAFQIVHCFDCYLSAAGMKCFDWTHRFGMYYLNSCGSIHKNKIHFLLLSFYVYSSTSHLFCSVPWKLGRLLSDLIHKEILMYEYIPWFSLKRKTLCLLDGWYWEYVKHLNCVLNWIKVERKHGAVLCLTLFRDERQRQVVVRRNVSWNSVPWLRIEK